MNRIHAMNIRCRCTRGGYSLIRSSKRTPRREFLAVIDLPQHSCIIPLSALRAHLPDLYSQARQEGIRRIEPMSWVRPNLVSFSDLPYCELAINWIFLHVSQYQAQQCVCQPWPAIPRNENSIEILIDCLLTADVQGDRATAVQNLDDALAIFEATGSLLRPGVFGCGQQILYAYREAAHRLAPFLITESQEGERLYRLIRGMVLASKKHSRPVLDLVGAFSLEARLELRNYCDRLSQAGDVMASIISDLLL